MGSDVEVTAADREKAALKAYIADHAAVWETEFAAGPGLVVSLDDAAHVAAKYIADERAKASCITCNGRVWSVQRAEWINTRETVGMVCQTCGTDYAPAEDPPEVSET